jgi:RNA polymerase sigma-70 factor (ECF subfamily)
MVMDLTPQGGQVSGVYLVTNPDKLSGVLRDEDAPPGSGSAG